MILDAKGIVQSAHVGYNPDAAEPLHKSLAKEIDTLLAGQVAGGIQEQGWRRSEERRIEISADFRGRKNN